MAIAIFDDFGIRFEYPPDWEPEVTDDGSRATVSVQAPDGAAFAIITADRERPEPAEMAAEALSAMHAEYSSLEASAASETIDGHPAVGHDADFFSLDLVTSCAIRCFRTPRRTVLVFAQWAEIEGDEAEDAVRMLRRSLEETDS